MDAASPLRRRGRGTAAGSGGWEGKLEGEAGARLVEFQRNAAFVAFIGVVVSAALALLVEQLRTVLIPLIWATFFALPLERMAKKLNTLIIQVASALLGRCRSEGVQLHPVDFRRTPGHNRFTIQNTPANRAMIDRLRNPFVGSSCSQALMDSCGLRGLWAENGRRVLSHPFRRLGCQCAVILKCCQRRLRITQVTRAGAPSSDQRPVNRVTEKWCYYVGNVTGAGTDELHLQLFLDQGLLDGSGTKGSGTSAMLLCRRCCDYPAIVEGLPDADAAGEGEERGTFEMDRTSPISWVFAILLVIILVAGGLCGFGVLLNLAASSFIQNLDSYEKGVAQLIDWLKQITPRQVSQEFWDHIGQKLQNFLRTFLGGYAESFLTGFSTSLFQLIMFFIYLLFWLFEPIPVSSPVVEVFKTYLFLKSLVCLLFALLMSVMLACLGCQLWPLFFVLTFFLNYIPEIGALISGLISLPAVLLDADAGSPKERVWKALYLVILGLLFKFITGNIIEVHMYTTRGGEFMRMHSVVLMALIMVFGQILGITGMFLSVPMVAAVKYYLISADIPPTIVDPLLCFIEGDEMAVHKTFVDKTMALRAEGPAAGEAAAGASVEECGGEPLMAPRSEGPEAGEPVVPMGEPLLLELGGSAERVAEQEPSRGSRAA